MVYLYNASANDKNQVPDLSKNRLLVPPLGTNRLPWTRGYFETVDHRVLGSEERLPVHCFRDLTAATERFLDERGRALGAPVEPVGDYSLHSFRTIDDAVSEALGIPLVPDGS